MQCAVIRFGDDVRICRYDIAARKMHGAKALTNFSLKEATKNVGDTFTVKPKEAPPPKVTKSAPGPPTIVHRVSSSTCDYLEW